MSATPPPFDAARCEELAAALEADAFVCGWPEIAAQLRAAVREVEHQKLCRQGASETVKVKERQLAEWMARCDEARAECERLREVASRNYLHTVRLRGRDEP